MKNLNSTLGVSPDSQKKIKSKLRKYKGPLALLVAVLIIGLFLWSSTQSSVFEFAFGNQSKVEDAQGRVNILLLGTGGTKHDGPNLTDTIILASYDLKTKKAVMISLPRDLWIESYKTKVNTLYPIGLKRDGDGLDFVQTEVGKVLGVDIPYSIRVDFNGFVKAVDLVNGLDIQIEHSFDDYLYPLTGKEDDLCGYEEQTIEVDDEKSKVLNIPTGKQKVYVKDGQTATDSAKLELGCRFEHLVFTQGPSHMDGETALKFVRSRHGTGAEGSDFARSKRQQLVIQAFRDKVLSLGTLTDPAKIISLLQTFGSSIATNIPAGQYLSFLKFAQEEQGVKSYVIDSSNKENLLINPPPSSYGGGWVLIPPNNDFTKIHEFVQSILDGSIEATPSATPAAR